MLKFFIILILIFISNMSYSDNLNKDLKIEKIIKEYILKNPEVIIESLEQYTLNQKEKDKKDIESTLNNFYEEGIHNTFPSIGNKSSNLVLIEFIDYNCGYCKKTLSTITELINNIKDIKVVFIDYPILSETSELAAKASLAANKQEAYFKFHTILLNNRELISESFLLKTANKLGLDINKFKKDMYSLEVQNAIKKNIVLANNLKIRGTPTFIIGNQILPGAYDYSKLKNILLNKS